MTAKKHPGANGPAVLQRVGRGSLSDQTTKALLDAILGRSFPDDRLPAEPELAELLNVSRTTLRAALQSLERLGVLSRAPGRGTIVRPHVGRESIVLQRLIGFRGLLEESNKQVDVEQRYWIADRPTPEAVMALLISPDDPVIVSDKRFIADGACAIHISDQIPLVYAPDSVRQMLSEGGAFPVPDSIFAFSRTWPGREIDHTLVELVPSVVGDETDFPLDLKPGTPFMLLLEKHYTSAGEPVAISTVHVHDGYVRFNVVRHN